MTYDQLNAMCAKISKSLVDLHVDDLDPSGDELQWQEVSSLNDEFNMYLSRLLHMAGKKREAEYLHPTCVPVKKDGRKGDTGLYLITLSPPPENQNQAFIDAVHRFVNLSVVEEAKYCFEQRGVTEGDYQGIHTHILCQRRGKPYAFKKELDRIFNKFFREGFGKKQKNVENVEITEKSKVLRYICGEKNGRNNDKRRKVENDKLFRRDWKLEDLYEVTRA